MPLPMKVSTNKIYAGVHWTERDQAKDDFHWAVKSVKSKIPKLNAFPVGIEYTFFLKGRPVDSSNLSYMAKMIEDALVEIGAIPDDSPKFVSFTKLVSKSGKENEVEVRFYGPADQSTLLTIGS